MNMQTLPPETFVAMPSGVVDALLPMHVQVDAGGKISHIGPTLSKMIGDGPVFDRPLLDLFSIRRPSGIETFDALMNAADQRLSLCLTRADHLPFRGVILPLQGEGGAILNLSFGLSFARAVAEFSLTLSDFAATDQTIELLYLNEAKASTTRLSEHLTNRLQNANAIAQEQARTDVLTGLSNRRAMDDELEHLMACRGQNFTLMHLDLDLFKQVNDTHGHAAGDAVLVEIGRILDRELRRNDFPARIGGDEFLIVLRPAQSNDIAARIAKRIIERIEEPIDLGDVTVQISASIGIASTAAYATRPSIEQLMNDVDEALYDAKRNGRGRFCIFMPGQDESAILTDLE
ncbi:diguanylate cyclase domain-containing protein [Gymnodinialimonas hymeniacidonis]|uniref:diguanylate cyclase domain-containing protein n=1 Tax=Gymnodinialimonas hymeniacidonis TaxID=3126508 RepID=UPI0034C66BD3